jgi:V8-like Glu-specific endopeptidase
MGMASADQEVFVIGHPVGLPLKYAGNAKITDNSPSTYFSANLDTFGGNSGSPVFSMVDGKHIVEGILVRGETDFVEVNGCTRSQVYPTTGQMGENCTRVAEFAHLVPEI